jgi:butyrate kinase
MDKSFKILAVNPGSTSTKIAAFADDSLLFQENLDHKAADLAQFRHFTDELPYRRNLIVDVLMARGYALDDFDVFVARGAGLDPVEGGTYIVGDLMLSHAMGDGHGARHPANLGSVLAKEFSNLSAGQPAFIVDPPDTDELEAPARISGLKEFPRRSGFHALSQKEAARRAASALGKAYGESRFVVAHVGGGVSVGAHKNGRVVDTDDLTSGTGAIAPTRPGWTPIRYVAQKCFSGEYTPESLEDILMKRGGVVDHLGTSDMREVERRIEDGDKYAACVYEAMLSSVAKSIGGFATVLEGRLDAIVLTGGVMHSKLAQAGLKKRVEFIAPVLIYPGEFEMEALCHGALRVLRGEEEAKHYTGAPPPAS